MKLRNKIHLGIAVIIIAALATALLLSRTVVFRKFLDVERTWITQNVKRARNAITDEIAGIDSHAKDWAWWNATYDFVVERGEDFIRENLSASALAALEINYIFFIDTSNALVHSAGVDLVEQASVDVPKGIMQDVTIKAPLFVPTNTKGGVTGIKSYPPFGIFMIASRHILDSEESGSTNGTLIMMRRIDDEVVEDWERLVQRNIEVYAEDDPMLPVQVAEAFGNGESHAETILVTPDEETIRGYSILNDIAGRPALAVMVEGPRTVWAYAKAAVFYLMLTLVLLAVASFTTTSLCLRRKVLAHAAEVENEELSASKQELERSNEELARLNKDRVDFTSMVSHEMRTPLGTIQQSIEIMLDGIDGPITENQTERLTIAKRNVERLIKLANDILDLTRLDTGKLKLIFKTTDLRHVVDEIASLMKPQAEKKGVALSVKEPSGPINARCDGDRIGQAMINLVSNAIRATESGGTVTLKLIDLGSDVRIEVEDTGRGIEEERIPKLFKPFSQLRTHRSKEGDSTGLGLSICKQIVDSHGGRCKVASELGKGSTFSIIIPKSGPTT